MVFATSAIKGLLFIVLACNADNTCGSPTITQLFYNRFVFEGTFTLQEFNDAVGTNIQSSHEIDTFGNDQEKANAAVVRGAMELTFFQYSTRLPTEVKSARYFYDSFGRRVYKIISGMEQHINSIDQLQINGSYQYVYFGNTLIQESHNFSDKFAQVVSYVYENEGTKELLASENNGKITYGVYGFGGNLEYKFHWNGDNWVIIDGEKTSTDVFGNTIISALTPERVMWHGHYYDGETGLYYAGARYYDPRMGRFISPDPLGAFFDLSNFGNGYTYAGNNSIAFRDAHGEFAFLAAIVPIVKGIIVGAVIGGTVAAAIDSTVQVAANGSLYLNDVGRTWKAAKIGAAFGAIGGGAGGLASQLGWHGVRATLFVGGVDIAAQATYGIASGLSPGEAFAQGLIGVSLGYGAGYTSGAVWNVASKVFKTNKGIVKELISIKGMWKAAEARLRSHMVLRKAHLLKSEFKAAFEAIGITDARVKIIGSAAHGVKGFDKIKTAKMLDDVLFKSGSDVDINIFSQQITRFIRVSRREELKAYATRTLKSYAFEERALLTDEAGTVFRRLLERSRTFLGREVEIKGIFGGKEIPGETIIP